MGLDIFSQSDKEYSASYGGLHYIRYMAYRALKGKKSYSDWHEMQRRESEPDWAYADCLLFYPNLYYHSDCEGTYTLRGKLDFTEGKLLTGNSKQLLWELEDIKEMLQIGKHVAGKYFAENANVTARDIKLFNMLYELVKDTVENYNGRLELH